MTTSSAARAHGCGALAICLFFFTASVSHAASGVGVTGQGGYVTQPDPKHPSQYLWKLYARDFSIETLGKSSSGTLKDVTAILFEKGAASAKLVARQVQGDNVQNIIVATGGVVVTSLKEAGTIVKADKVTWYHDKDQFVATGHVFYQNGKTKMTIRPSGPLVLNTLLKNVRSDGAGTIKLP